MRLAKILVTAVLLAAGGAHAFELCDSADKFTEFNEALSSIGKAFHEKRFDDLEAVLGGLMGGHRLGRIDDARLKRAFAGFETQDPGFEPLILEWARRYPKSSAAYLALGHHYMARGELGYAFEAFAVSDRLGARPTLSNAARVRMALAVGDAKKLDAGAIYRKTIAAYPEALEVRIQYLKGRGATTQATLERIEKIMGDAARMNEADRRYVRYLGHQEMGVVLASAGERSRAAQEYERSYPLCPGLPHSIKLAIELYDQLGDWAALERTSNYFLQRESRHCWALSLRAKARRETGRLQESFADYSRGVELACGESFEGLAWFYENGRVAPKDLRKAAELYRMAGVHGVAGAQRKSERIRASFPR